MARCEGGGVVQQKPAEARRAETLEDENGNEAGFCLQRLAIATASMASSGGGNTTRLPE
jgi:hypothetical protein